MMMISSHFDLFDVDEYRA